MNEATGVSNERAALDEVKDRMTDISQDNNYYTRDERMVALEVLEIIRKYEDA